MIKILKMRGLDLKKLREKHNLTQDEFGKLADISKRTVINWEQSEFISDGKVKLIHAIFENISPENHPYNYSNKDIDHLFRENTVHYQKEKDKYRITDYGELVELGLKVVANYEDLKQLKIVNNLFEIDILEEKLRMKDETK